MLSFTVYVSIAGAIMLFLGTFSYITATYHHESRLIITLLSIVGLALVIFGAITLPKDLHNQSEAKRTPSTQKKAEASSLVNHSRNLVFDGGAKQRAAAHQQLNEQSVKNQLANSYKTMGALTFNHREKTYTLTIKDSGYNKAMTYLKAHPNQAKQIKWPQSIDSFEKTGLSIKKSLGTGYQLIIRASVPKVQTILTLRDGKVTQNFAG